VTWGWESLHRELPGTEDLKTLKCRVPKSLPGLATSCAVGPGEERLEVGSWELKREASARTSGDQKPETRNTEVPKSQNF
jgi:hypothetical protein